MSVSGGVFEWKAKRVAESVLIPKNVVAEKPTACYRMEANTGRNYKLVRRKSMMIVKEV